MDFHSGGVAVVVVVVLVVAVIVAVEGPSFGMYPVSVTFRDIHL